MPHLDEGTLTALFDGELARDEREAAERHLADCGDCRRLSEEIRAFAAEAGTLVDQLQPERMPLASARLPGRPGWERFRPLAWAATLVLAAGLGWSASTLRFAGSAAEAPKAGVVGNAVPPVSALPADRGAAEAIAEERAQPGARQDETPRSPATAPSTAAPAGAAKVAKGAPPAETDRVQADLAERAEVAAPSAAPTGLASQPRQARAAELNALRDAPAAGGAFREVPLEEAVRTLGGSVKLIDGLNPTRVQLGPTERVSGGPTLELVRITYLDPPGRELWLDQQRSPVPSEGRAGPAPTASLLDGDTVVSAAGGGLSRVRWMSPDGFRLTLTGYLPGDSLRALVRRVH